MSCRTNSNASSAARTPEAGLTITRICTRCTREVATGVGSYCPDCAREKRRTDRLRGKARVTLRQRTLSVFGNQCAAIVDGERCVVMGPLEIHHIDGDRRNDAFENKVPLCRPHHRKCAGLPREAFAEPVEPWIA